MSIFTPTIPGRSKDARTWVIVRVWASAGPAKKPSSPAQAAAGRIAGPAGGRPRPGLPDACGTGMPASMPRLLGKQPVLLVIRPREPGLRHGDDADVEGAVVVREHRGLDLDLRAVRIEGRVDVVRRRRLLAHGREEGHLPGVPVDDPEPEPEVVGARPASARRSVDVPDRAASVADGHLPDDTHLVGAKVHYADSRGMLVRPHRA